ncbi:hypothetical protein [Hymenobacter nivis]|uniref:Uncharacterized protein n=1 Tax=Hymenobacter nivis TaxID=1850093 RepID=A0A2Z3GQT1_9BACT|nr:hypothetical protein [Hymenobacter nivis]AWM34811.1 hypothetical protein DDQ68_19735 [Hymenobacter nivis]
MSEEFNDAQQKERNWGTATPEELRAEMKRMRDDLTKKVDAFIKTLDGCARSVEHSNPPGTNASKPIDTNEASSS